MFNIFKRKYQIDFTGDNKVKLISLLSEIYELLRDNGFSFHSNWIRQIISAISDENQEDFIKKVLSNEFLGGAGSIIDVVLIDDEMKSKKLSYLLNEFLKLTLKAGLNHRAVRSNINYKL